MREHHLTLTTWNAVGLRTGERTFLVVPDTSPPLHYGDTLVLHLPDGGPPLRRLIRYAESGVGYERDYVGVELAPGAVVGHGAMRRFLDLHTTLTHLAEEFDRLRLGVADRLTTPEEAAFLGLIFALEEIIACLPPLAFGKDPT